MSQVKWLREIDQPVLMKRRYRERDTARPVKTLNKTCFERFLPGGSKRAHVIEVTKIVLKRRNYHANYLRVGRPSRTLANRKHGVSRCGCLIDRRLRLNCIRLALKLCTTLPGVPGIIRHASKNRTFYIHRTLVTTLSLADFKFDRSRECYSEVFRDV